MVRISVKPLFPDPSVRLLFLSLRIGSYRVQYVLVTVNGVIQFQKAINGEKTIPQRSGNIGMVITSKPSSMSISHTRVEQLPKSF